MAATTEKKTVVIIGAGLSGLQAAVKLIQSGSFQVKLLEATDQAGGRVNTSWKFGSFPIELGANWIHGNHGNPVYELAKKHKLLHDGGKNVLNRFGEWFDDEDENYFYTENGMKINYKLAKKAVDIYHKIVDKCDNTGQKLDDGSRANVGDMIDNEGIKEIEKLKLTEKERRQMLGLLEWAKKLECVDNACQSTYDLSLRWFGEYVALPGDYYTEMGQGGYQALVDLLLSKIPVECLQYNKPVKSVDWCGAKSERSEVKDDRHVIGVECTDGEKVTADHVIVTTSLGFLKENSETFFNPVLPEEKLKAISKVGYGNIGKIFLRFKNRFWNKHLDGIQFIWDSCDAASSKETQSKTSHEEWMKSNWFRNICGFERVLYHKTTLVGWIYGKEAEYMESLDDEEIKNMCVRLLGQFTGKNIPEVTDILVTKWQSNPYTRGTYSYVAVGAKGTDVDVLAEPLYLMNQLNDKVPRVLFCGEATHRQFISTAHGAFVSGEREAERLIKYYK